MVNVNMPQKRDEDPLDKLVKFTSIGTSIASLAGRAGATKKDDGESPMLRRLEATQSPPNSRYNLGIKY